MFFLFRALKFWFVLVFAVLAGYMALYNQERVAVVLPPWVEHVSVPLYIAFAGFFTTGAVVTTVVFGMDSMRKSVRIRRLERRLRDAGLDESRPGGSAGGTALDAGPAVERISSYNRPS